MDNKSPPVARTGAISYPIMLHSKIDLNKYALSLEINGQTIHTKMHDTLISNHLQVHTLLTCGCHPYATENEVKAFGTFGD